LASGQTRLQSAGQATRAACLYIAALIANVLICRILRVSSDRICSAVGCRRRVNTDSDVAMPPGGQISLAVDMGCPFVRSIGAAKGQLRVSTRVMPAISAVARIQPAAIRL
jgi:hypothetical protein